MIRFKARNVKRDRESHKDGRVNLSRRHNNLKLVLCLKVTKGIKQS